MLAVEKNNENRTTAPAHLMRWVTVSCVMGAESLAVPGTLVQFAVMAPVGAVSSFFVFGILQGLGFLWRHQRQELEDQPSLSDPEQAGSHAAEFGLLVHQDHS